MEPDILKSSIRPAHLGGAPLLEPVGLGQIHSDLYLDLLAFPRSTITAMATRMGLPASRVRKTLQFLLDAGLVSRLAGARHCYVAAPPEVAVDALVARRSQQLEQLRVHAHELALAMRSQVQPGEAAELIQLVEGAEAVSHHLARMQLGAREEVLIVDCPPYLFGRPVHNEEELKALARGVSFRCLYHAPGLEEPGHLDSMLECVAAGEQARTLPEVRMKMIIADRRLALVPVSFSAAETGTRLLVQASPLLDALVSCFESMWERGTPAGSTEESLTEPDRKLLAMLASGMKDRAIARTLGVTERTVGRRVQELMSQLDASTRFQAGLQAARHGLL